jgi:malonyl CoA-acyl carrier protein transacylase
MATTAPKSALLFPGQGSQHAGMRDVVESFRPDLLELALREVGSDPFERADEGTRFAQPAIYCASLAGWARAGSPDADLLAGHSLGEIAALAAAGAIAAADGLRLTVRRGELMEEAAARRPGGGMVALLGDAEEASALAAAHGLTVANDNAPTQLVVSGPDAALEGCVAEAKERGVRPIRLAVAGAFHSPAIEPAVEPFRAALERTPVAEPRVPVFSSSTARPFERIRVELAEALVRPVRWRETVLTLERRGVERFVEVGPGKALAGMVRRTLDGVEAVTLDVPEAAVA